MRTKLGLTLDEWARVEVHEVMSIEETLVWFIVAAATKRELQLIVSKQPSLVAGYLANALWRQAEKRFGITGR